MSKTQLTAVSPRLMLAYDTREHCEVVAGMIDKSGLTIERVARLIGKNPTTLARELNPTDEGAKLGFTDEVKITAVCGLFDSRDYAEFHLGRCAFLLPQAEGQFADVFETVGPGHQGVWRVHDQAGRERPAGFRGRRGHLPGRGGRGPGRAQGRGATARHGAGFSHWHPLPRWGREALTLKGLGRGGGRIG